MIQDPTARPSATEGPAASQTTAVELELAAFEAYETGASWADFWRLHGQSVERIERGSLFQRLLSIVTCGDSDGMTPAGDDEEPAETIDEWHPDDVGTQARCLIPLLEGVL